MELEQSQTAVQKTKRFACTWAVLACLLSLVTSCGGSSLFGSKSEESTGGPAPEPTLVPPVPVIGSYLTSIVLDENSKPIAQAEVSAEGGKWVARSDDKGRFSLPVNLVKDDAVELDIKTSRQTFYLKLALPGDIADAVRAADPGAGTKLERGLGIKLTNYQAPPPNAPKQRFLAATFSLPAQWIESATTGNPALIFAVTSHKNGDAVSNSVTLKGSCNIGRPIRVTGDLRINLDTLCLASGAQGIFEATVFFSEPAGAKSLTVTQTDSSTGEQISQLLNLNSSNTASLMLTR